MDIGALDLLIYILTSILIGASGGYAVTRRVLNKGNPNNCRFSQTAIGQELEPLRTALEAVGQQLVAVNTKLDTLIQQRSD